MFPFFLNHIRYDFNLQPVAGMRGTNEAILGEKSSINNIQCQETLMP